MIAKTIAEQMDQTRKMTRFYLSQLKEADPYEIHTIKNKKVNPIIWEIGHLTVTQNWLVMYLCKGPAERISWAKYLVWEAHQLLIKKIIRLMMRFAARLNIFTKNQ